jgi:hypothetical protein
MKPPFKSAFSTQGDDYGGSPEGPKDSFGGSLSHRDAFGMGHMTIEKQIINI